MYLSQFRLNLANKEAIRDLANPYEMHRTLKRLVGDEQVLWRLAQQTALVITPNEPLWHELPNDYLREDAKTRDYPIDDLKLEKRALAFELVANPTRSRKSKDNPKGRGQRQFIHQEKDQRTWLENQGVRHGFILSEVVVEQQNSIRFTKKAFGPQITVGSCSFRGSLRVSDETLFKQALKTGIGPAKAFGFGLLTVRPG